MSHPDADLLALAALGEGMDPETERHLSECSACREELAALRRTVRAARMHDGDSLQSPAPAVWDRIADEVGIPVEPRPGETEETTAEQPEPASVASLSERRRGWSRRLPLLAAAAVGLVLGAVGSVLVGEVLRDGSPAQPTPSTLATADLQPLPDGGTRGQATIVRDDGVRRLEVSVKPVAGEAPELGFREVWLLDPEDGRLVSLGVLEGRRASFTLPADLDLRDYPTVDISTEPFDGDPAHSGVSLARGELTF